jgi:hypothetical protein
MADMQQGQGDQVVKPTPDPTSLTVDAVRREVSKLEESAKERATWFERELGLRQTSRENEIAELKHRMDRARKSDRKLIKAQLNIVHERYLGQERILNLIEEQRKERKEDDRRALDAALAAAEKARVADTEASDRANTKTELSTAEQLKQQNATSVQANAGTIALLNTLQTRVERIENVKQGNAEERTEQRSGNTSNALLIGALVGVGGLIFSIISLAVGIYFATQR